MEQQLEGLLGSDYIDVIVEAGPSTGFLSEVRRGGKFALMKCNWGADYADPATWTEPFSDTGSDSYLHWRADTAAGVRDIIAEYDALVAEAKAQVEDMSVRYNTFAQAEASIINHAVIIPYGVEGDGFKATRLNELEAEYAPYGLARQRYKYQKLRTEPMSQNEFNPLYEAWQAARDKALAAEYSDCKSRLCPDAPDRAGGRNNGRLLSLGNGCARFLMKAVCTAGIVCPPSNKTTK